MTHWGLPQDLRGLTDGVRRELQRHHVVDWLLANADAHREQFLILVYGNEEFLVGIDKSQSMRFFPHDRLEWDAHA